MSNFSDHDREAIIDQLMKNEMGGASFQKNASSETNPFGLTDEDMIKIAKFNLELGRLRGIGFIKEARQQALETWEALGLDPETIAEDLVKEGSVVGSTPIPDMVSKVLDFIFKRISPHMMINAYRPGVYGARGQSIDPEDSPVAKNDGTVDYTNLNRTVGRPTSIFGKRN